MVDADERKLMWIYGAVVSSIMLYWFLLRMNSGNWNVANADWMNTTLFTAPWGEKVSWWPMSHFILNAILGYFFPDKGVFILGAGVAWELIEAGIGLAASKGLYPSQFKDIEKTIDERNTSTMSRQYEDSWWAGSMQDVLFNTAGFLAGRTLRKVTSPKEGI